MQMLGVFWKIQDIYYNMVTEIEVETTGKMMAQVANLPSKNV